MHVTLSENSDHKNPEYLNSKNINFLNPILIFLFFAVINILKSLENIWRKESYESSNHSIVGTDHSLLKEGTTLC